MSSEKKCCVPNCSSELGKDTLHRFPNPSKDPERFRTWLYNIGGDIVALENEKIMRSRRVCHLHFEPRYHTRSKLLSPDAVPRLNLPGNSITGRPQKKDQPARPEKPDCSKTDKQILDGNDALGKSKAIPDDADELVETEPPSCEEIVTEEQVLQDLSETASVQHDGEFSWQQSNAAEVPDDEHSDEDLQCLDMDVTTVEPARSDKRALPETDDTATDTVPVHEGFQCNHCHSDIIGFRYTCVQCADYDLCAACEALRTHAAHYALRVPAPRPQAEIAKVLQAIREALQRDFIVTGFRELDEISIKEEAVELPDNLEEAVTIMDEGQTDTDKANMLNTDLSDSDTDDSMRTESRDVNQLENPDHQMDSDTELIEYLESDVDEEESCSNKKMNLEVVNSENQRTDHELKIVVNQKATDDNQITKNVHRHLGAKPVKCSDQKVAPLKCHDHVPIRIKDGLQIRLERCNLKVLGSNTATVSAVDPRSSTKRLAERSVAIPVKRQNLASLPIHKSQTSHMAGEARTLTQCELRSSSPRRVSKGVLLYHKLTRKKI